MDRRTFLVALTPLAAGCFGGSPDESADATTDTPESTTTDTPEPTPEPTPTATPEPEASSEAAQRLETAEDHFNEAVYLFTGGVTDDLLSVTANTESFRARDVLLRLDRVQRALTEADAAATTDEQRSVVESLDRMQRFLTFATDAQSWLIDGHDALEEAYSHMDDGDLGDAEADVDAVETAAEEVMEPTSTVQEEMDVESASAVAAVDADEYEGKVEQLVAQADVFDVLADGASDIRDGVSLLERARDESADGQTDRAADTADRAQDVLSDAEETVDDLLDDFPDRAEAFETVAEDLRYLASREASEADTVYDNNA